MMEPKMHVTDPDGDKLEISVSDSVQHPHTAAYLHTSRAGVWLTREEAARASKVLAKLAGGQCGPCDLPSVTVHHDGGLDAAPLYLSGGTLRRPTESPGATRLFEEEVQRAREVLAIAATIRRARA